MITRSRKQIFDINSNLLNEAKTKYTDNFKSNSNTSLNKFKSISNHQWGDDDTKYDNVLNYLKFNRIPEHLTDNENIKNRYIFKKFANQYKVHR